MNSRTVGMTTTSTYSAGVKSRLPSSLRRMRQQDRGSDHVALPGRLVGGQRLGGAEVRAERLDEIEGLALRERARFGRQIREYDVDRGVDLLVGNLGGLAQLGDGGGFFGHRFP